MQTYLLILTDKAPNGQHTATIWTPQPYGITIRADGSI